MTGTEKAKEVLYNRLLNKFALHTKRDRISTDDAIDAVDDVLSQQKYDPLTEEEIETLLEAGASKEFIMVAQYDFGDFNTTRKAADRALERDDPEHAHFGGFAGHLWSGDVYYAMSQADNENTRILLEVFGLNYINAQARRNGKSGYRETDDGQVVYK